MGDAHDHSFGHEDFDPHWRNHESQHREGKRMDNNRGNGGGGNKPAIKVAVKPRSGEGGRISVCAAWRDEATGRLRASFDKRVARIVIVLDDGAKVDIQRGADGKFGHFVDVFENDAPQGHAAGRAPRPAAASRSVDDLLGDGGGYAGPGDAPGSYGGDDIPF